MQCKQQKNLLFSAACVKGPQLLVIMNKTPPVAIRGTVVFGFSLLALPFGAYVILACGRELVTTMRKSSPSIFGRSSQYTASPVAWLMADRCIMGRPTASWLLWSFETG